jgi:hypothetical protein
VRACNALGRGLEAAGARVGLDAEHLLDRARRRTGLADFGDDAFREPLDLLCQALDAEAELTPLGRWLARREIGTLLEGRLRIEAAFAGDPGLASEEIRAPIFVTGSGRSGTSILHELLAQDPASRALLTWEALRPCPPPDPPGRESDPPGRESDPRIAQAEREVRLWERIAPAYRTMHEMGGRVPQECIYLTAFELRSDLLSGFYQVPSYAAWLARCDMRPGYAAHRRVLQILQRRLSTPRWVLKAPSHLWTLEALLAVYPDARIVWTHRDPLRVLASMASLAATLYWLRSDRVDLRRVARQTSRSVAFLLEKATRQRDAGIVPEERVFDVRYQQLVDDPFGTLRALYDHFGMPWSAEAEQRMRAHLAARPQHRHGEHRYAFADTGLDPARERERFAPYRTHFGVPEEK